jgi:GTP pyrophosphokinase
MVSNIKDALYHITQCRDLESAKGILESHMPKSPRLNEAIALATTFHNGQYRKSGEPYIVHPVLVAALVALFGGDEDMAIAAILHDTVEDTECTVGLVEERFGETIANLVEGLTKIDEIRSDELIPSSSSDKLIKSALSFRKMLVASIDDSRVLILKLCDRLHNMMTLGSLPPEKQKRISEESLVVYAPIAHRLGISAMKNRLEDLSFFYLMPEEYHKIEDFIKENENKLNVKFNVFVQRVENELFKMGFERDDFKIYKRIKHLYSIYLKIQRKGISIEEVLDLLAIRIIVKEPIDCYRVLGAMHLNFRPLIGRFKDYVTLPKENGYQTIHTTLFDDTSIIEVQIRTVDMHKVAEYGIAAHWKYKSNALNPKLNWIKNIEEHEKDTENILEYYESGKNELFTEDMMVYSPRGDTFTLPRGSTALDFAYAVHTDVGDRAQQAYINKEKVPLLSILSNSDIVKIDVSDSPIYRCSWIESVKTSKAKNSIRQNCKVKLKDINEKIAMGILAAIFKTSNKMILKWLEESDYKNKVDRLAVDEQLLKESISYLKKQALQMHNVFIILKQNRFNVKRLKFDNIELYSNLFISSCTFDYCCHPKVGDDIVAIKNGSSVSVHHKFCTHANELIEEGNTILYVKWAKNDINRYRLMVTLENKKGAIASFLSYLAKIDINIVAIELKRNEGSLKDIFELEIELSSKRAKEIKKKIINKYRTVEFISTKDAYS